MNTLQEILDSIGELTPQQQEDIRGFFMAHTANVFRTEGEYSGAKWANYDNEPKYKAFKKALTGGEYLLKWPGSNRLYDSLTVRNDPDQVWRTNRGGGWTFGTKLDYADQLRTGGTGPFGEEFPARDFLSIGPRGLSNFAMLLSKVYLGIDVSPAEWRRE